MHIFASDVADFLGVSLNGNNVALERPQSLDEDPEAGGLRFAKQPTDDIVNTLNRCTRGLAIVSPSFAGRLACPHVITFNPRLAFAMVLSRFFAPTRREEIASTAKIGKSVRIGAGVAIGEYSVIGDEVEIGPGTTIGHHVVITDGTLIGANCVIRSHAVIGEEGFGFDFDENGRPVRLPHLGRVRIKDNVEVGSFSTISRATLTETVLEDYVKVDDRVHIAHNARIGAKTLIISGAVVCGSSRVGEECWIGPNASVIDKVTIGNKSLVGLGAVVVKDVAENTVSSGNPAIVLRERFHAKG